MSRFLSKLGRFLLVPPWLWPWRIMTKLTSPVLPGVWLMNGFAQRILRVNAEYPWMVHFTSRVVGKVELGKNVSVSLACSGGVYIQGNNGVQIGDDTLIAPGVKIISANHNPQDLSHHRPGPPVRIGKRCWLGANCIILPGVELGDDVIVAAGAVVTKSFPSGCVLAGVPATVLKKQDPQTTSAH